MASIKKSPFSLILRPLITEKTAVASSANNTYVFEVHPKANKTEIAKAIKTAFSVEVAAVRTINYLGKEKRVGMKIGHKKAWKKAYVSLKAGHTIDFVEGL